MSTQTRICYGVDQEKKSKFVKNSDNCEMANGRANTVHLRVKVAFLVALQSP